MLNKLLAQTNHALAGIALLAGALTFALPGTLRAQAVCQGTACGSLPITADQLGGLAVNLKFQYADLLTRDMADASTAGTLLGLPQGSVKMDGTYVGGIGIGFGFESTYNVFVFTEYGSLTGIESGGYSLNPKFFGGVNLGRVLGKNDGDRLGPFEWNRIEVYGSFFNRTISNGNGAQFNAGDGFVFNEQQALQANGTLDLTQGFTFDATKGVRFSDQNSIALSAQGVEVRYVALEGGDSLGVSWIEFMGVSAGVGFYRSSADLEVIQATSELEINLGSAGTVVWDSWGLATYNLSMRSIPVEVRSGLEFWGFLRLTGAAGISFNSGTVSLSYIRYGNAFVRDTNLFSFLGSTSDSNLGVVVASDAKIRSNTFYFKPGVEFSFPYFKLTFEGLMSRQSEGFNLGMRVEI